MSLPGVGIRIINEDFHIAGILQVVTERLKFNCFILCLVHSSAINSLNSSPQLGQVCLLVDGVNKSSHFCRLCTQMRFWMSLFNLGSSCEVGSFLIEVISSVHHVHYLCLYMSLIEYVASSGDVVWPALSRNVRKIFSSLCQPVGRECLVRATSTSYQYRSQLSFFRLTYVRCRSGLEGVNNGSQEHEVMRELWRAKLLATWTIHPHYGCFNRI